MRRATNMKRSTTKASPKLSGGEKPQVNLADKLIETIRNLSSNKDLLSTRISLLNGEGLKTASIMEIAGMYRSLVSQVAVLYDTDDFQNIVAPFIEKRFAELGSPSLIPGTIGSYIFGCYLSDYGMESLNKFCTPICAASIRVPNRNKIVMRCTEKVIWTDGGDTPIFILIEEDPLNSAHGKVFIPWVGAPTTFRGLTQGAIDEIQSLGVDVVEIFGQLFNNRYLTLMEKRSLASVPIVERIRIRCVDYVNSKNGGTVGEKCPQVEVPEGTDPEQTEGNINTKHSSEDDKNNKKVGKLDWLTHVNNIAFVLLITAVILMLYMLWLKVSGSGKSPTTTTEKQQQENQLPPPPPPATMTDSTA